MAEKTFNFLSPGVFIEENDQSQFTPAAAPEGPLIIGRAERGPAIRPVKINTFREFVQTFGNPIAGGDSGDMWIDGNYSAPTYAPYAAQAWLKNGGGVQFIRLVGHEHAEKETAGVAGWKAGTIGATHREGGAFGLFVWPSGTSDGGDAPYGQEAVGTLAAVWYLTTGSIWLSGNLPAGSAFAPGAPHRGNSLLLEGVGTSKKNFHVQVTNGAGSVTKDALFNFTKGNAEYIRKVFNTNPTKTNSSIYDSADVETYWLGETFEDTLNNCYLDHPATGTVDISAQLAGASGWYGAILGLENAQDSNIEHSDNNRGAAKSKSGWFVSQHVGSAATFNFENDTSKLFRIVSHEEGTWSQNNLKISIRDIQNAKNPDIDPYGTFTVLIRHLRDTDAKVETLESFPNCNLNKDSEHFIGRKIGTQYSHFNSTTRRLATLGTYPNKSKYVYVELATEIEYGTIQNKGLLPYGVFGPLRYRPFSISSGTLSTPLELAAGTALDGHVAGTANTYCVGGKAKLSDAFGELPLATGHQHNTLLLGLTGLDNDNGLATASVIFPSLQIRRNSKSGSLSSPQQAYFGVYTDGNNGVLNKGMRDYLRPRPGTKQSYVPTAAEGTECQYMFTLDDLKIMSHEGASPTAGKHHAEYVSGSRAGETSITAVSGANAVLSLGFNKFSTVLHGGTDGFDVTEREPFNNVDLSGKNEKNSYAYNSLVESIDISRDPDELEYNVAAIPGITNTAITALLLQRVEERGDALGIIDLQNDYVPDTERKLSEETTYLGSVDSAITSLTDRGLNTSYGCAYYPWVKINDNINNQLVWVPPSVVALGVMSFNDRVRAPWFAPAGFSRGGLSGGAGGLPVIDVRQKLNSDDRDDLYSNNINPIASFPNEGVVVFGQKTLQLQASALDRINVRRMLLFCKRGITRIARGVLFDPNVQVTWNRFISEANPFLENVKADFGLVDFKLVLDETTTTPDMQDRNIIFARIFLKPTKAAEFIAIEFNITSQGASFS